MTQNRLTITAEAAAVFADLIRVFFPPLCIHLLMGCLRNDTSLGYQAPFPASAQSLRGRYPYGTQTHPLTSHKHQPQLVLNATVRLYVLQPALLKKRKKERDCPPSSSFWCIWNHIITRRLKPIDYPRRVFVMKAIKSYESQRPFTRKPQSQMKEKKNHDMTHHL